MNQIPTLQEEPLLIFLVPLACYLLYRIGISTRSNLLFKLGGWLIVLFCAAMIVTVLSGLALGWQH